jgi:hypothetical protein
MRFVRDILLSLGAIGTILYVLICFGMLGLTFFGSIYGLYLAFSASVLLGVLCIFIQPSPLVIGLVMLFFHKNVAQMIMDALSK